MGLTMTDEQEFGIRAVLDRVPDHVNANAKRLLAELDATRAKLAECEQKAESYDLTHTGDWFERAHALGQRDPAKYAGRDIWHVAVEMAESLAEVERERHRDHEARAQMEHELSEAGCATVADLVRERDEARAEIAYAVEHGIPGLVATAKDGIDKAAALYTTALAAWQAECARLREALEERGEHGRKCPWAYFSAGRPKDGGGYEMLYREAWYEVRPDDKRPACTCGLNAALASAPGSTDALREVCMRVADHVAFFANTHPISKADAHTIVSRILGERSDDAPQGRGERGKEDGDA